MFYENEVTNLGCDCKLKRHRPPSVTEGAMPIPQMELLPFIPITPAQRVPCENFLPPMFSGFGVLSSSCKSKPNDGSYEFVTKINHSHPHPQTQDSYWPHSQPTKLTKLSIKSRWLLSTPSSTTTTLILLPKRRYFNQTGTKFKSLGGLSKLSRQSCWEQEKKWGTY